LKTVTYERLIFILGSIGIASALAEVFGNLGLARGYTSPPDQRYPVQGGVIDCRNVNHLHMCRSRRSLLVGEENKKSKRQATTFLDDGSKRIDFD
jgi:hypothetical protein